MKKLTTIILTIATITYVVAALINLELFLYVSLSSGLIMVIWAKYDSIKYPCEDLKDEADI